MIDADSLTTTAHLDPQGGHYRRIDRREKEAILEPVAIPGFAVSLKGYK